VKWLLGTKEMRQQIGNRSPKDQVEILDSTMKETDKILKGIGKKKRNKSKTK